MQVLHSGEEYTLLKERIPIGQAVLREGYLASFMIDPAWRRRGYGSYLLKEILRSNDGFSPSVAAAHRTWWTQQEKIHRSCAEFP